MRKTCLLLVGLLLAAPSLACASAGEAVEVRTAPVPAFEPRQPEQVRFGALRFIGGLQVDSPDKRIGGLSGIEISGDGRDIVTVSDVGDLIAARIEYRDGRPAGLSNVTIERLTGENGRPLDRKFSSDAEAVRAAGGRGLPDRLLVAFERDNRVLIYDLDAGTVTRLPLPDTVRELPYNRGLEAVAVVPPGARNAGAIVVFSETAQEGRPGEIAGWIVEGGRTRDVALTRSGDFDVTDAVALDNGDLIVLERRFNVLSGVAMRLRRIRAAELTGPQPMSGEELLTAGMAYAVDNMEGIAVHRDEAGRTILTLVSDDNFSALQRTLILQFELVE